MTQENQADLPLCYEIGFVEDPEHPGNFLEREMAFERDGRVYTVSVARVSYRKQVLSSNEPLPHDQRLDDNFLVVGDNVIQDVVSICRILHTLSPEQLRPYITPQAES